MMKTEKKDNLINIISETVRLGLLFSLTVTVIIMVIAALDRNSTGEAPMGLFESRDFNEGWTLMLHGEQNDITLPSNIDTNPGDELILSNVLPEDIDNGMTIMMRASMQDISVYIGGKLRSAYSSNTIEGSNYYLPSAYVVTQIDKEDAGESISVHLTVKNKGTLNGVTINRGNNGWFGAIRRSILMNFISFFVLLCGGGIAIIVLLLRKSYKTEAAGCLGILIADVALWMISESVLRQLLFSRPSLSHYFSYLAFELIAPLACRYFDAVQHKKYHKR